MASETISDIANDIVSQYWSQEKIEEWMHAAIRDAVKVEREACARVVETQYRRDADGIDKDWTADGAKTRLTRRIADTIRARTPQQESRDE